MEGEDYLPWLVDGGVPTLDGGYLPWLVDGRHLPWMERTYLDRGYPKVSTPQPGQDRGYPKVGTPSLVRYPQPGQDGGYPKVGFPLAKVGTPQSGLDEGYPKVGTPLLEDLVHGGRYASCVHAGGPSCFFCYFYFCTKTRIS